jgi:hypothetical protein
MTIANNMSKKIQTWLWENALHNGLDIMHSSQKKFSISFLMLLFPVINTNYRKGSINKIKSLVWNCKNVQSLKEFVNLKLEII